MRFNIANFRLLGMVLLLISLTLVAPRVAQPQGRSTSNNSLIAAFKQRGYEFGWYSAAANNDDESQLKFVKITDIEPDGDQLNISYDWHGGLLSGKLTGNTLRGSWRQDNGSGEVELTFDTKLDLARGWWNSASDQTKHNAIMRTTRKDDSNPTQRNAFTRSSEGGLSQYNFRSSAGQQLVPTGQTIQPAGQTVAFSGRPVDMALSLDRKIVFVKGTDNLVVFDALKWQPIQCLAYPAGEAGSMHGLAVTSESLYVTGSHNHLLEARRNAQGRWQWSRQISLGNGNCNPCGVAISPNQGTAYVCLSIRNSLALIDLASGKINAEIPTGVCPIAVSLAKDGQTAYVCNFGGRRSRSGEHAEDSAGTPVVVDERSISMSGTISRIDLKAHQVTAEIAVGLHPADAKLSPDGSRLYVANANSDSISVLEVGSQLAVVETISVRPDPKLPFGSIPNALAVSEDGRWLFVANAGNNALAMVELGNEPGRGSALKGFIPTGWFPGAVCTDGTHLFVGNVKGEPSRLNTAQATSWNSKANRGSATKVEIPRADQLARLSEECKKDGRVPQMLPDEQTASQGRSPLPIPIPQHSGEPSSIKHVVYVIKENRTYDQLFGDLPRGNNDPRLCTYGRNVTPNHHALAEEFVLLDNYYCNGVVSADGHQWATQGAVTDYQEKMFGGFARGFDFGTDALCYAQCNFLWDSVLKSGQSVRNYGEFDFPALTSRNATWFDVHADAQKQNPQITFRQSVALETLRKYTSTEYPGWNLAIPDVVRMKGFLKELKQYEKSGQWPNLLIVYLPQDHTAGVGDDHPTPRAYMADNDLALGQLVEAISHSRFWPNTAIFVNEDDPQDGWDHVDGHRSLCLVISPFSKRHVVISNFYNQLSVLHTIERILGITSGGQLTAQAPTMDACFTNVPNLSAYEAKANQIPLDERNKRAASVTGKERKLMEASKTFDFSRPDRVDDDTFNRILWHASMGMNARYPAEVAGAHGKGLKALNLKLISTHDG